MTETELIRALGGAEAICKPGCSCRGKYTGPERRQSHREGVEQARFDPRAGRWGRGGKWIPKKSA